MKDLKNIKAVIFDWAGTTVDYGCIAPARVFVDVFKQKGISISLSEARGPMGLAKHDHVKELFQLNNVKKQWTELTGKSPVESDMDAIYRDVEPAMVKTAANYATPINGAVDLLQQLHEFGIKVGSTTGYVDSIMEEVSRVAAQFYFVPDALVTSSEVDSGRPAPFMCYLNAIKLNVFPLHKMIKVGDTVADIQEGLNAGMWTIGITKTGNEMGLSEEETEKVSGTVLQERMNAAIKKLSEAGAHYIIEGIWDCMPVIHEIDSRIFKGEMPPVKN